MTSLGRTLGGLAAAAALAFTVTEARAEGIGDRVGIRGHSDAAPFSWTGFYIGGHVGHAWANVDWDRGAQTKGLNQRPEGAFAGGQIGFNKQVGRWVGGLEGSLSGSGIAETSPPDSFLDFKSDIQLLWSMTGRLGYAWDRWFAYGKAGYAGGRVETSLSTPLDFSAAQTRTHHGWTVGLGVEYMLGPNIAVGLEYSYIDLGNAHYRLRDLVVDVVPIEVRTDNDVTAHSVLARLNYKFGQ